MKIYDYRKRAGMTQAELAQRVDVDHTAISIWERGVNPPLPKHRKRIAAAFGVRVEDIDWGEKNGNHRSTCKG